ncbi:DNA-binding response regulator [Salipaludibacillus neizhouensis]|uniref:DNA-binding response regulator n=1 Tax=Salipaludibacillus neizhouensis TaxID=885475 RepID=A0A3A9K6E0_9BACI|nr:response regulator transcription factor [Salipaludibacillus neizhouensis]RKL66062.1 DNA-binding response regulator [Salipaludibacillus neizhouensis]
MIRIVIAEDQKMLLGALAALLDLEEDMSVVGSASNGEDAVNLVYKHDPDVCIMDIEMPKRTGLDAAEELKELDCKVIILTTFARSGYFQRAVKAGVNGYMLKDNPSEELANAIRSVMDGRRIYAPELVDEFYSPQNPLTDRENDVLALMAAGKSTKDIADELHLTNGTVRNYISSILEKLEVTNRIEAITRFKEKGWSK